MSQRANRVALGAVAGVDAVVLYGAAFMTEVLQFGAGHGLSMPAVDAAISDLVATEHCGGALSLRISPTGLVSLGGFLGAFVFDRVLSRAYFLVLERQVVVHSPRELLMGLFIVGLSVSAIAVLIYGIGSRFGPLKTRFPS